MTEDEKMLSRECGDNMETTTRRQGYDAFEEWAKDQGLWADEEIIQLASHAFNAGLAAGRKEAQVLLKALDDVTEHCAESHYEDCAYINDEDLDCTCGSGPAWENACQALTAYRKEPRDEREMRPQKSQRKCGVDINWI